MLIPCPSCMRHVRGAEQRCPFCRAALPEGAVAVPGTKQRLTRAAACAFSALAATGAAAASAASACGGTTDTNQDAGNEPPSN